eukprot:5128332-Pleurochrysis_carterae.AAC.2
MKFKRIVHNARKVATCVVERCKEERGVAQGDGERWQQRQRIQASLRGDGERDNPASARTECGKPLSVRVRL